MMMMMMMMMMVIIVQKIDDTSSLTLRASASEISRENIMHRSSNLNLVMLSDDDSGL